MTRIGLTRSLPPGCPAAMLLLLIACLLALSFTSGVSAATETLIDDRELFGVVFPGNSVIRQQQVTLDNDLRERLDRRFHVIPTTGIVMVWMASEPNDGHLLGGLIKVNDVYRQKPLTIAIAMSTEQRITRAAIVAIDPLIREAFASTIGVGYLKRYTMLSVRQLSYLSNVLAKRDQPSAWATEQIFKYGAILTTILESQR